MVRSKEKRFYLERTVAPTVRPAGSRSGLEHDLEAALRPVAEDVVPTRGILQRQVVGGHRGAERAADLAHEAP